MICKGGCKDIFAFAGFKAMHANTVCTVQTGNDQQSTFHHGLISMELRADAITSDSATCLCKHNICMLLSVLPLNQSATYSEMDPMWGGPFVFGDISAKLEAVYTARLASFVQLTRAGCIIYPGKRASIGLAYLEQPQRRVS